MVNQRGVTFVLLFIHSISYRKWLNTSPTSFCAPHPLLSGPLCKCRGQIRVFPFNSSKPKLCWKVKCNILNLPFLFLNNFFFNIKSQKARSSQAWMIINWYFRKPTILPSLSYLIYICFKNKKAQLVFLGIFLHLLMKSVKCIDFRGTGQVGNYHVWIGRDSDFWNRVSVMICSGIYVWIYFCILLIRTIICP